MNGVAIVGGSGFLGSHLVDRLAAGAGPVVVLSRSGRWPWGPPPDRVSFVRCDLEDRGSEEALAQVVRRVGVVIQLAGALFRPSTPSSRYRSLHVDGTRRIVDACRREVARDGIPRRLVHVSTTGVLGATGPTPLSESAPPHPATIYEVTKHEGEVLALAGRGGGLEVVVARPGLVYGPRDLHLVGLWRAIASGRFRVIAGGRAAWQPVHVRDVAAGLEILAGSAGLDGEVFHLAGPEPRTWRQIAECIAVSLGVPVRGPGLPYSLAFCAGAVLEVLFAPFGVDPPLSRSRVRTFTEDRVYQISRARERLLWEPRIGFERGVAETTAWYRAGGLL